MSMVAVGIGAAVSVAGGLVAANQAKQAAKGQANAAKQANQLAASEYEQNRLDQAPWREAGGAAVTDCLPFWVYRDRGQRVMVRSISNSTMTRTQTLGLNSASQWPTRPWSVARRRREI